MYRWNKELLATIAALVSRITDEANMILQFRAAVV